MGKKLDQVLVVDVESTCWEKNPPKGQQSDIIEIGICTLDLNSLKRLEKRSILVIPTRSEISPFCTELTTLTMDHLKDAVTLEEACRMLKKEYLSQDRVWASYGDYDRRQFERNCGDLGIKYPFGTRHLNVKTLFAMSLGLTNEVGTGGALKMLGHPFEGTPHRGHDDAWNIALVLADLLKAGRTLKST